MQELEDSYGVKMSDEEAARIATVGQAVDFVVDHAPRQPVAAPDRLDRLRQLLDEVPEGLRQQVFTHASWTDRRSDSYSRLAFLGDSVLGLAITAHLYPRLEAERYGAGRLTKIRAQTVSGAVVPGGGRAPRRARAPGGRRAVGDRAERVDADVGPSACSPR